MSLPTIKPLTIPYLLLQRFVFEYLPWLTDVDVFQNMGVCKILSSSAGSLATQKISKSWQKIEFDGACYRRIEDSPFPYGDLIRIYLNLSVHVSILCCAPLPFWISSSRIQDEWGCLRVFTLHCIFASIVSGTDGARLVLSIGSQNPAGKPVHDQKEW